MKWALEWARWGNGNCCWEKGSDSFFFFSELDNNQKLLTHQRAFICAFFFFAITVTTVAVAVPPLDLIGRTYLSIRSLHTQ